MKNIITQFNETGNCTIDVAKVAKVWTDKFSIYKYHEEYRLIKQGRWHNLVKVTISKEQAEMLIDKLKLLPIQSTILRHVKTYRTESYIIAEMERIHKIKIEKQSELSIINSVIDELKSAFAER